MYPVQCDRCKARAELLEKPRQPGFLCNNCWLKWTEIRDKFQKNGFHPEKVDALFIKFVNDFIFPKGIV